MAEKQASADSTGGSSKTGKNVQDVLTELGAKEAEINRLLNVLAANLYSSAEEQKNGQIELAKTGIYLVLLGHKMECQIGFKSGLS